MRLAASMLPAIFCASCSAVSVGNVAVGPTVPMVYGRYDIQPPRGYPSESASMVSMDIALDIGDDERPGITLFYDLVECSDPANGSFRSSIFTDGEDVALKARSSNAEEVLHAHVFLPERLELFLDAPDGSTIRREITMDAACIIVRGITHTRYIQSRPVRLLP